MFAFLRSSGRDHSEAMLAAIDRSQAVIQFDLDGNILDANANFLRLTGYSLDELKGRHHRIFVDPAERDGAAYRNFWEELRAGQYQTGEYLRIGKDGHDIWIQASYNPLFEQGHTSGVVKFASDITAAKMHSLEDAGKITAISRAQAVIEFAMDGTILFANELFLETMGYTLPELKGQHHRLFVDPNERDTPAYTEFWQRLGRGEYLSGEYKRIAKGGREVWILASYNPIFDGRGRPFKVVKFANNVTAQKLQAADSDGQIAAIRKSQAVIEFATDGTILDANANFLDAVGYGLAEIKGKHHRIFVDPVDRDSPAYREFWPALARGEYKAGEFRRIGKGGREIWIQASYNPILGLDGRPFKVVKYAADITRQVRTRMGSDRVSGMLEQVASGAGKLNGSVRDIADAMTKSRQTASSAVGEVDAADGQANRLNDAAQAMSGIVELIGHITGQINLLALNATIESARAGEAGRGFAVVAAEVKNLANQAKQATDKIGAEIENLNNISGDVVGALDKIKSAIQAVSEYVTSTAAAVEEQSTVTSEMSSSMQRAAQEAAAIAAG